MRTGRLLSGVGLGLFLLAGQSAFAQTGSWPPPPPPPVGEPRPFTNDVSPPPPPPPPQGRPAAMTTMTTSATTADPSTALPVAQALVPSMTPENNVTHVDGPAYAPGGSCGAGECAPGCSKWIFSGDYLYMRARREANDFAVFAPNNFAVPNGSIESVDWASQSGFRVGAAYEMENGWQWGLQYTYFHSQGMAAYSVPSGGSLYATMARGGGIDDVTYASADSNINYQVFDIVAAKNIKWTDVDLLVNAGVRTAFIDQTLNALYNGGSVGATNAIVSSPVYFRGAGLTLGGEGTYHIYKGFGLYARAQGSLLSGETHNLLTETNDNGSVPVVVVSEKHENIIPVAELGMGFSWEYEHVFIKVGYELTDWFGLINSPAFTDSTNIGLPTRRTSDLTLEALAVQLGVTF
jgi:hypothetical protein